MNNRAQYSETDPRHHTAKLKGMLTDVINHARGDVNKIEDPKAQALFETTAEVLIGLRKAFDDFEQQSEDAWRRVGFSPRAKSSSKSPPKASTKAPLLRPSAP